MTMEGRGPVEITLAAVITAGAANIWNGLDVAPGRADKYFFIAAIPTLFAPVRGPGWLLLLFATGAVVGVVSFDLRERGMLGDTGSNSLGFVVGAALAPSLTALGLWLFAGGVLVLNVLADTVTFSRIIDGFPPLRWFDRLGRLPSGPRFSSN